MVGLEEAHPVLLGVLPQQHSSEDLHKARLMYQLSIIIIIIDRAKLRTRVHRILWVTVLWADFWIPVVVIRNKWG